MGSLLPPPPEKKTNIKHTLDLTMATEAATDEHVGEERVEANDAILIKGIVVIIASPSTA